jgi:putative colanic acid biosynthesis UDP-glucose lipid carrier transferase
MTHNEHVKDNNNPYSVLYRLIDLLLIQLVLFLCITFFSVTSNDSYVIISLIASIVFFFTAEGMQLYRSWRARLTSRFVLYTLICWSFAVFAVVIYLFFSKSGENSSRLVVGFWFLNTAILLVTWRMLLRLYLFKRRKQGFNTRKVAIFGLTDAGISLANEFVNHPETGFTLDSFFDDRDIERLPSKHQSTLKGNVDDGVELARSGKFDVVYIALPLAAHKRTGEILRELGDTTVDVHLVPDFFTFNLINARLTHVGNIQTISVYESPYAGLSSCAKRIEDIIGSALILCCIAIPMLIIAMLIKLDSKGPVFFKQRRYGLDGKSIEVWKFRSMTVADNGDVVKQATKGDARITKLGATLRRTSLDELPQFINVLQGQMSIVGPRPHAVAHNEEYRNLVNFYMLRHKVKPGITGWAQINGWRGETDTLDKMKKRIEFDLAYIRRWSFLFDLKIIFLTIFKGFINKNAY